MNEAVILEKLDSLTEEIRSMKADILQELREEICSKERVEDVSQPEQKKDYELETAQLQMVCQELLLGLDELLQQTSLLSDVNKWLHDLQIASPGIRLAGTTLRELKNLEFNEEKVARLGDVIKDMDMKNIEPMGPMGLLKQLQDPQAQKALGLCFMLLQTLGACVQAWERSDATTD